MSYGIVFYNDDNEISVYGAGIGYRYFGQPTLISSGSVNNYPWVYDFRFGETNYGEVLPYVYEITLPRTGIFPIVLIKLDSLSIVASGGVNEISPGVWRIEVFSVFNTSSTHPTANPMVIEGIQLSSPNIKVFIPYDAADPSNSIGAIINNDYSQRTFDSSYKPLFIKERVSYAINQAIDSLTISISNSFNQLYATNTYGLGEATARKAESQEDVLYELYGWTISSTNILAHPFIRVRYPRDLEVDDEYSLPSTFEAGNLLLAEGTLY